MKLPSPFENIRCGQGDRENIEKLFKALPCLIGGEATAAQLARSRDELARNLPQQHAVGRGFDQFERAFLTNRIGFVTGVDKDVCVKSDHAVRHGSADCRRS